MHTNLSKNIEKIFSEFNKLGNYSKMILKYGIRVFLALFALGTLLVVINYAYFKFDLYIDLIATSVVKSSFAILAEAVIGGLLMDYFFNKQKE